MDEYDDEGLVCGICFACLQREDDESDEDLKHDALSVGWQCIVNHGEHWFCPKHKLRVVEHGASLPVSQRLLLRGLVDVVEVVQQS